MNPSIGRIVHFRIGGTDEEPELRPALIVRVWSPTSVNLQVFFDGSNDVPRPPAEADGIRPDLDEAERGLGWRTSVTEGDGVGYWRWPARG